jgi:hypothetical protein
VPPSEPLSGSDEALSKCTSVAFSPDGDKLWRRSRVSDEFVTRRPELSGLPIPSTPGNASCIEDALGDLGRDRPVGVLASLPPARDGEERVHRPLMVGGLALRVASRSASSRCRPSRKGRRKGETAQAWSRGRAFDVLAESPDWIDTHGARTGRGEPSPGGGSAATGQKSALERYGSSCQAHTRIVEQ